MAENNEEGVKIPGEAESAQANPTEFDLKRDEAIKDKARQFGWKPKSEYEGDPADWRPAKEFLERQSFFDKIKSVKDDLYHSRQENKKLQKDLNVIKDYVKKMSEVEYKRALADLQLQKNTAVADANVDEVKRIDAQIDSIKESKAEIKAEEQAVPAGPPPEFNTWVEKNKWYQDDAELRNQADEFGFGILAKNRGLPVEEVLRQVEIKIKKMYPEKFNTNTGKRGAPAVEAGGVQGAGLPRGKGKLSESDLDETQRKAMDAFVKRGVLTKEKYLESLSKSMGMS